MRFFVIYRPFFAILFLDSLIIVPKSVDTGQLNVTSKEPTKGHQRSPDNIGKQNFGLRYRRSLLGNDSSISRICSTSLWFHPYIWYSILTKGSCVFSVLSKDTSKWHRYILLRYSKYFCGISSARVAVQSSSFCSSFDVWRICGFVCRTIRRCSRRKTVQNNVAVCKSIYNLQRRYLTA